MNTPFFTIVIPTKNRPVLLKDAIQSVLWQNYTDFELIVSDNFNDVATQEVIASFSNHPKFRSVRTEHELNMIDHWEFATKHAVGKYVIVLADRKVLYQNALKKITKAIKKFPDINAFSVGVQTYDEINGKMAWNNPIGKSEILNTKDLMSNFLNVNLFTVKTLDSRFPKTLNGVYKNDFARFVREKYGHYFNNLGVTTPDFSSFLVNCALNNQVVYIGHKIILTQGESASNGRAFGAGKYEAYLNSLGMSDPFQKIGIKAPFIYSLLMIDFETIKSEIAGNLSTLRVDSDNFLQTTYFEYCMKRSLQLNTKELSYFEYAWIDGAKSYGKVEEQKRIRQQVEEVFNTRNLPIKFDKIIRLRSHVKDFLSIRLSKQNKINYIFKYYFKTVFEAANFKKS